MTQTRGWKVPEEISFPQQSPSQDRYTSFSSSTLSRSFCFLVGIKFQRPHYQNFCIFIGMVVLPVETLSKFIELKILESSAFYRTQIILSNVDLKSRTKAWAPVLQAALTAHLLPQGSRSSPRAFVFQA